MAIYFSERIKGEMDYFRRLHENFVVAVIDKQIPVKDLDEKILYMILSASYAMDVSEEGLFENFIITDKQITNKPEIQLDAYAFVETERTDERHLHLFQYKLFEDQNRSASPKDVHGFASLMNDIFIHPELRNDDVHNSVFREIEAKVDSFINSRRSYKIKVKCHFITNSYGIRKQNAQTFEDILGRFEHDKQHRGFDVQVYGEEEIWELATGDGKIKTGVETIQIIVDEMNSYRLEDNTKKEGLGLPRRVFVGVCNVNELIRLQNKYHHNQLYSENIRLYLGDKMSVNKDIIRTITSDESIWFPYMNNGISIICENIEISPPNPKKQIMNIKLTNLQIINGCQTVNALYSAKYGKDTGDSFRASNLIIKIYQVDPSNQRFKQNVIRASNSQNAVKSYSLVANDPIQIEIQKIMERLGYVYDRKGEARQKKGEKTVSMVQAALAYRSVFEFGAQKLRSKIGQSRVFQKEAYERIYKEEYLEYLNENSQELSTLSVKLLIGTLIMDNIRKLLNEQAEYYIDDLPIIRKSTYYLAGLYYAVHKNVCDELIGSLADLAMDKQNPTRIKHSTIIRDFIEKIRADFVGLVKIYAHFYKSIDADKTDIDNLLKADKFGEAYESYIRAKKWGN